MILAARRVLGVVPGEAVEGWVRAEGDRIVEVGTGAAPDGAEVLGGWLTPGLVDLHVHGGGGAGFQEGDPAEVRTAVAFHRGHGTTTLLASLVSAPVEDLARACGRLAAAVEERLVAGVHLEGPFLSADRCGAHDPALLVDPTPDRLQRLLASGPVRMVTIAPEREGALAAIDALVAAGVVAAVGHTDATYDTTRAAIAAGATVATHLGNGMRPLHHREPGPILALLEDPRVVVELINDEQHLHPAMVDRLLRSLPDRVALVTDAVQAAGLPDGRYRLGGHAIDVRGGVSTLAGGTSLAGSTIPLARAVANAVHRGASPAAAVAAATAVPARVLGLQAEVGVLAPGARADVVAFDDDFGVSAVWHDGRRIR